MSPVAANGVQLVEERACQRPGAFDGQHHAGLGGLRRLDDQPGAVVVVMEAGAHHERERPQGGRDRNRVGGTRDDGDERRLALVVAVLGVVVGGIFGRRR